MRSNPLYKISGGFFNCQLTASYLLSLFTPTHNQLPVVAVATAKWQLLPRQLHAAVPFPPTQPITYCFPVSFPLTTNCLLLPLQQPSGHCSPASFMPLSLFPHTAKCPLFPSLFPPSQPIACCCRCNNQVDIAAQPASCLLKIGQLALLSYWDA